MASLSHEDRARSRVRFYPSMMSAEEANDAPSGTSAHSDGPAPHPTFYAGNNFVGTSIPMGVIRLYIDSIAVIPARSFRGRVQLQEVVLCEGVVKIGEEAFSGCKSLSRLHLPSTLREIARGAFRHCDKLAEVNLPDSVETIGEYSFMGCR